MNTLTKKQKQIYDFITDYVEQNGYPPTVREIGSGLGLKSPATVHTHMENLKRLGLINKNSSKNRAFTLNEIEKKGTLKNEVLKDENSKNEGIDFLEVPVIGRVAAGTPILATENVERTFLLPMDFAKNKDVFMLKVSGDSMINAGIFDGDYVIVQKQEVALNGEMVVALIEDEATVKTFYKENGYSRLQPENDYLEPIITTELSILGKVVGLIRLM